MCDNAKTDTSSDCITLCKCACFYCKSCKKVVCKCETSKCPEELAKCFKVDCICGDKCICCDKKSGIEENCLCGDACRCCTKDKAKCCSPSDCVVLCQCVCYFCKSCKKVICKCERGILEMPSKEASSNISEEKCVVCDDKSACEGNSSCEGSCHCAESSERITLCKCALFYSKASKKLTCKCEKGECSDMPTCSAEAVCCVSSDFGQGCDKSKGASNANWIPLCKCTCYYCKSCNKMVCKCETYTCPEELSGIDESNCGEKCMC